MPTSLNNTNKPLLSICIPTFCGAVPLQKSLRIMADQIKQDHLSETVEVVVSDNASTDNTGEVVKSFSAIIPRLIYSVNGENLGYDRNVAKVLSLARGDYCWLMSDSELLNPGTIKFVVDFLTAHPELGYVCVDNHSIVKNGHARFFKSGSQWLEEVGLFGGLISQNIYRADVLPADMEKYFGNWWLHLSITLEVAAKQPSALIKNLFVSDPDDKIPRWTRGGKALTTFSFLFKIVLGAPQFGYDRKLTAKISSNMVKSLPRVVASAKLQGLPADLDVFKKLVTDFFDYPFYLAAAIMVLITPVSLITFFKRVLAGIFPKQFKLL